MRKILIFGATSSIAQETARLFAEKGDHFFLVARNSEKLGSVAEDLKVRGAGSVVTCALDATDVDRHQTVIEEATQKLTGLDTVLIAYGTLPDQKACEESFEFAKKEIETNCLSVLSLLTLAANQFEKQKKGTIAVISSVAGDRGRKSNYVYGASKGAVSIFLQGLRNRLYASGVHVLTIKPGFVDTPMTKSFEKGILWASPEKVARGIYNAIIKKKDVVYLPCFWRFIMLIITSIPEKIFKRLSL